MSTQVGIIYESSRNGAHPTIELKYCEQCGRLHSKPAGSTDKYCFQCHANWNKLEQ